MCELNLDLHVPERATILTVRTLSATEKLFKIELNSGEELGHKPGQFLELTIPNIGMAPISIASSPTDKEWFELGVRAIAGGNVTPALHRMQAGDTVFVSKPMGNGFPVDELTGKDLILVAGGIGLFPLRSLIRYVRANRPDFGVNRNGTDLGNVTILFGSKNPEERLLPEEISMWKRDSSIDFYETVDIGNESWKGNVGLITKLFSNMQNVEGRVQKVDAPNTRAVVIGPDVMFKFVTMELVKLGVSKDHIFASTERKMSCGLGFCRNCLLPNGKRACVDGPVFSASELCF
ncbi:MAG: FAD/NAD(P)-binding protein [Candidatus Paceibacterota bacterium]|jgi:NAD(P)H-flavin reductase